MYLCGVGGRGVDGHTYGGTCLEAQVQLCRVSSFLLLCELELELSGSSASAFHLIGPMLALKDCALLASSCRRVFWALDDHSNTKDSKAGQFQAR